MLGPRPHAGRRAGEAVADHDTNRSAVGHVRLGAGEKRHGYLISSPTHQVCRIRLRSGQLPGQYCAGPASASPLLLVRLTRQRVSIDEWAGRRSVVLAHEVRLRRPVAAPDLAALRL